MSSISSLQVDVEASSSVETPAASSPSSVTSSLSGVSSIGKLSVSLINLHYLFSYSFVWLGRFLVEDMNDDSGTSWLQEKEYVNPLDGQY